MENEFNNLKRLTEKELNELEKRLEAERKRREYERQKLIFEKRERARKELIQPKRRNFVRELKKGGISLAEIARETGISYYKIRQINLGKKKLKSRTPEYKKIRNLHSRIGYQQLRAKGINAKDARRLRTHKLRQELIFKKERADFWGYKMEADAIIFRDEVFIDKIVSKIIPEIDIDKMRQNIINQIKQKYEYDTEFEIIKEVIIKIYDD